MPARPHLTPLSEGWVPRGSLAAICTAVFIASMPTCLAGALRTFFVCQPRYPLPLWPLRRHSANSFHVHHFAGRANGSHRASTLRSSFLAASW